MRSPCDLHPSLLKLRNVDIHRRGAQGVASQIQSVTHTETAVLYQRRDVTYLVIPKVDFAEAGEVRERGDIAYLVAPEVEFAQVGEVREGRQVAYLVVAKPEFGQAGQVG